jgi:hypothetical protein
MFSSQLACLQPLAMINEGDNNYTKAIVVK